MFFLYPLLLSLISFSCSESSNSIGIETTSVTGERDQPCTDGVAAGYPCLNIDLRARLSPTDLFGERLNDIWGWTDPITLREYALVGLTDGVTIVDIEDPSEPIVVGKLPELTQASPKAAGGTGYFRSTDHDEKSSWRDLKVYEDHLFVVSDGQVHGLQVFDLNRLRNVTQVPVSFSTDAHYAGFGNAHNIAVNEESGYAYIVGSDVDGGGLYIVDISDPKQPEFVTTYADTLVGRDSTGYVHDTQCVMYGGPDADYAGNELCFNASETHFTVVDVTDKESIHTVSRNDYEGLGYAHQGWLTDDHRYFLLDDELDENQNGHKTRTYIWDVEDLENPEMIGIHEGPDGNIDHNQFVKANRVYQANYTAGLRILNLDEISSGQLQEIAYFDTYPDDNSPKLEGAWSTYPFFDNGIVIVSDITNGLFVLGPTVQ